MHTVRSQSFAAGSAGEVGLLASGNDSCSWDAMYWTWASRVIPIGC